MAITLIGTDTDTDDGILLFQHVLTDLSVTSVDVVIEVVDLNTIDH